MARGVQKHTGGSFFALSAFDGSTGLGQGGPWRANARQRAFFCASCPPKFKSLNPTKHQRSCPMLGHHRHGLALTSGASREERAAGPDA